MDPVRQEADEKALAKRIAVARARAGLALLLEEALPHLIAPLAIASLFLSAAWFGFFRTLPDWLRWVFVFGLIFSFLASLLPFLSLRWPKKAAVDRRLEIQNALPHQALVVQDDEPVTETAFARALWARHRARMAGLLGRLDPGSPRPDISLHDPLGLRAIPALTFALAFAFSFSGDAGRFSDAFRNHPGPQTIGLRTDIWVTPPAYTGKPALTLKEGETVPAIPQFSMLTVRKSGEGMPESIRFQPAGVADPQALTPTKEPSASAGDVQSLSLRLSRDGALLIGDRRIDIRLLPDQPPRIAFDGDPRRSANGALEIRYKGSDDYGLKSARAEIVPVDETPGAEPLFPLPDYPIDLPAQVRGEVKGLASRNLTDHPLSGKRVRITLLTEDAAGQTGRSEPRELVLPARAFGEPLAAAIAEERQIFSLDVRDLAKAIAFNDAITLRADESIPNLTHYLLVKSARSRMALARTGADLKDTAAYLWEIALGIDGGDLPVAEKAVRDAQKALADALKRNAPDAEVKALMDNLRKAMQDYMTALSRRMQQPRAGDNNAEARNVIRQQDLERMMDQLENMARSGNREAAEKLLSDMQRLMNNLQAGPSQRQPPTEAEKKAREQVDKLGKLLSEQQKLLDETFKLNQQLMQQQWQEGQKSTEEDPMDGLSGEDPMQQPMPDQNGAEGKEQPSPQGKSAKELQLQMQALEKRQRELEQQLKELGQGLKELGMKPNKGFGEAGKEMGEAGKALGRGEGDPALGAQGRAIEALRKGAREMMQSMSGKGRGQGPMQAGPGGQGESGRDPLGRARDGNGLGDDNYGKVPDEVDVQRAREILDAIRRKLGDGSISPAGRTYLERLLNLN